MYPKFSIIIPHYDIPDLLMRCLRSILVSEDIQVIVVDDHSPDADTYIDKYPELSRPYLELIRAPKNGGAGYARNVGLGQARGKWLMFADADDFFAEGMMDIISAHYDSKADVIFFRKNSVDSSDISQEVDMSMQIDKIINTYIQTGDEWPLRILFSPPWAKMVRKELVDERNIVFDEVRYSNDVYFSACVGFYAKTIVVVDNVIYIRTKRKGQLTDDENINSDSLRIRAEVDIRTEKFLMQHGISREKLIKPKLLRMLVYNRELFKYFFYYRLQEIYPSKWAVVKDLFGGRSLKFKIRYVPYILYLVIKLNK